MFALVDIDVMQRYFVLAHGFDSTPESPTIELRVFGKAVDSAWGFIPIQVFKYLGPTLMYC